jgi:hypothetical protein
MYRAIASVPTGAFNAAQWVRVPSISIAASGPSAQVGDLWYSTGAGALLTWDGSAWRPAFKCDAGVASGGKWEVNFPFER